MSQGDPVKHRDRVFIYIRDGKRCLKCESTKRLTIDHVVPRALGGENHWTNYQTLCSPCNASKGATIADYRPNPDGQLWFALAAPAPRDMAPERFAEKIIKKKSGCWLWTASSHFSMDGVAIPVRRASYAFHHGSIPDDQWVVSTCGTDDCVAPEHLKLVTPGNHSPYTQTQDQCRKGHPFTPENTAIDCGVKRCRTCRNDKQRRYHARRRAQALAS